MTEVGLYLSGAGSLDGSDVFSAVLGYLGLQARGLEPVPVGRDIEQGEVINHRNAQSEPNPRNSLDESARIVRGQIQDMRYVEVDQLSAALFVGGGGTLSTWTDFHQRGADCRVTERLKYQVLDLYRGDKPLLCLGNAGFVLARILRDSTDNLRMNLGRNDHLNEVLRDWDVELSDEDPFWDERNRIGSLPDLADRTDLPSVLGDLSRLLDRSGLGTDEASA